MKKMYLPLCAVFTALSMSSHAQQTTLTFEELPLSGAESFFSGPDGQSIFTSQGVDFAHSFNEEFNFWGGFTYSNVTDNTTAGYENQYAAFPGSGANNSSVFVLNYGGQGTITFNEAKSVQQISLANTTYAALSMRDGDQFSKKFGGTSGNDPDYFYVRIYGWNENGSATDSVDFFLADYRFEDNSQDYVLSTWENVSLNFPHVKQLSFKFFSSDMSGGWINTPTYVALDNLVFGPSQLNTSVVNKLTGVYPNPFADEIHVPAGNGSVKLLDSQGRIVIESDLSAGKIATSELQAGTYFLYVEGFSPVKLLKK